MKVNENGTDLPTDKGFVLGQDLELRP